MSIERELLQRSLDTIALSRGGSGDWLLTDEIRAYLAQPEQEPVGVVRTIGGYPDNSQHTVELTGRHGDLRDGDLLYLAPPKREPLSEQAIWTANTEQLFEEGVRWAEQQHRITGR